MLLLLLILNWDSLILIIKILLRVVLLNIWLRLNIDKDVATNLFSWFILTKWRYISFFAFISIIFTITFFILIINSIDILWKRDEIIIKLKWISSMLSQCRYRLLLLCICFFYFSGKSIFFYYLRKLNIIIIF